MSDECEGHVLVEISIRDLLIWFLSLGLCSFMFYRILVYLFVRLGF
jgi:hypothetical protein